MKRGLQKLLNLPEVLGHPIDPGATLLDLGCGNGERVHTLRDAGFDALGCDFVFKSGSHVDELTARNHIRKIFATPYRMPFGDDTFDFVFSEQVFEHVSNYDETLAEIHRVLKPGGVSLHVFPARLRFIEGHVHVPLASIYRAPGWLLFWARVGIRKPSQRSMSPIEVAQANRTYLEGHTNYLSRTQIVKHVTRYFSVYRFCEREALRYSRLAAFYPFLRFVPFLGALLSTFQTRVLFLVKSGSLPVRMARDTLKRIGRRQRKVATEPALNAQQNSRANG